MTEPTPQEMHDVIDQVRADLAETTTALVAKVDVKARVKAGVATAAAHVKDSTTGVTHRVAQAVGAGSTRTPRTSQPSRVNGVPVRRSLLARVRAALPQRNSARANQRSLPGRASGR
jgi:hypothetical protein